MCAEVAFSLFSSGHSAVMAVVIPFLHRFLSQLLFASCWGKGVFRKVLEKGSHFLFFGVQDWHI